MSDPIVFLIKTLGLGLLTGYVLGYLFKKTAKILIFLLALFVVIVFVLGHNEIMDIEWLAVKSMYQTSIEPYVEQYSARLNS